MPINSFLYPAPSTPTFAYEVANSLRFDDNSSHSLSRTPSSAGNTRLATFSFWLKRGHFGITPYTYMVSDGLNQFGMHIDTNDRLVCFHYNGSGYDFSLTSTSQFRDPSAWYHFVIKIDTANGTAIERLKLFVNGVYDAWNTTISQNFDGIWLKNSTAYIGSSTTPHAHYDGYFAEFVVIDGTALEPTSFGEFNSDSPTIWQPIDVSGLTFGTNGFYLEFKESGTGTNSSGMGADTSGNNGHFAVNNLTAVDQSTDTCTNNFATLNPLANLTGSPTFSEGSLKVAGDNSANHNWQTTFVVSSGKWYWELKDLTSSPDGSILFYDQSISSGSHPGYGFVLNTKKKVIGGSVTGSAIGSSAQNDIWSMALDLDNGKMFIARNGTYLSSGDPANGTNPFIQTSDGLPSEGVFGGHIYDGSMELNFGGGTPTSISSGNADDNGYGNFEYDVPAGFYSLCTKNLAEFG
tara:strand:- start:315 stop:1703 length:1389 start_codon:yes stop_codon:yes gene_type:complete